MRAKGIAAMLKTIKKIIMFKNLPVVVALLLTGVLVTSLFYAHKNNWWADFASKNSGKINQFNIIQKVDIDLNNLLDQIEKDKYVVSITNFLANQKNRKWDQQPGQDLSYWQKTFSIESQIDLQKWNSIQENIDQQIAEFSKSLDEFKALVTKNNWKTLTKITERMTDRNKMVLNYKNFSFHFSLHNKDVESMLGVVNGANLAAGEKQLLNEKLNNLGQTTKNLLTLYQNKYRYIDLTNLALVQFKKYWEKNRPILSSIFIERESSVHPLTYLFSLTSFFMLAFALALFYREKQSKVHSIAEQDQYISELFDKLIIKNDRSVLQKIPASRAEFKASLQQMSSYINKRMSYGHMFQETLPFPALYLDSNLQVRWFNKHFLEQWKLDDYITQRESINWELLSEFTNFNTMDAITEAMNNQLSGIYQIQVRPFGSDKTIPYQMYVSPYEMDKEKICLLFFYPLLSLEETIDMQTKSIVGPVGRSLQAILDDKFDLEFEKNSKKEYEVGGIENLHALFSKLYHRDQQRIQRLLVELNEMEALANDRLHVIRLVNQSFQHSFDTLKILQKDFLSLKNNCLSFIESSNVTQKISNELYVEWKDVLSKFTQANRETKNLEDEVTRLISLQSTLQTLKNHSKEARENINAHKLQLQRFIKALLTTFEKQGAKLHHFSTLENSLREIQKIPDFFVSLDKFAQHIEVMMGKISLEFDEVKRGKEGPVALELSYGGRCFEQLATSEKEMKLNFDVIAQQQEKFVHLMSEMYVQLQQQFKDHLEIKDHFSYVQNELIAESSNSNQAFFGKIKPNDAVIKNMDDDSYIN